MEATIERALFAGMASEQQREGPPPGFPELPAIPGGRYTDPDFLRLEQQYLWKRSWLYALHADELPRPGSFRMWRKTGAPIIIIRGKDGEVRAFHNVCTHRGTQLVDEASGKRSQFSCRYHMWTFGTDGRLMSAPDFERFYVAKEDCSLKQLPTQVLAGMIFVNFDPSPKQSVREFFGPIAEEMELLPVARAVEFTEWCYEIEANWKLNFDNFQENYHLRFIHPRTGAQAFGPENPLGYPSHYGFSGPHRSQTLWFNPDPPPPALTFRRRARRWHMLCACVVHNVCI